jgi:aryl-phospho-beta-D-glucosidase BglC (GH1 family)
LKYTINPKNYVTGGLAYIDKAFEWGLKNGIAILLCMHAAPGSQNGNDNSSPAVLGQVRHFYRSSSTKCLTNS